MIPTSWQEEGQRCSFLWRVCLHTGIKKSYPNASRRKIRSQTYLTCPRQLDRRSPASLLHSWPCWQECGGGKPTQLSEVKQKKCSQLLPSASPCHCDVNAEPGEEHHKDGTARSQALPFPCPPPPFFLCFFFLNNRDNWCYVPALNIAVTPHLALFVQNLPSAFWILLFASHWHCKIAKGT